MCGSLFIVSERVCRMHVNAMCMYGYRVVGAGVPTSSIGDIGLISGSTSYHRPPRE